LVVLVAIQLSVQGGGCAQYLPPVFNKPLLPSPPQTII